MEQTIDKELRRLQKAHVTLMRTPTFAFYSGILMLGKSEIDDNIPTACTNGRDVKYGRAFIKTLNDKELAFVVLHEAGHKMYRHLTVWKKLYKENAQLANAACDYVINIELKDLDPKEDTIQMPKIGLIDAKYRGMTSKQVYDLLKQQGGGGKGGGGGAQGAAECGRERHQRVAAVDGEHGLEVLNELRRIKNLEIRIPQSELTRSADIEAKLVFLAQSMRAKLLTTDTNLAKMAQFHGDEFHRGTDGRTGPEELGVTITGQHLRSRHRMQTECIADVTFDARAVAEGGVDDWAASGRPTVEFRRCGS